MSMPMCEALTTFRISFESIAGLTQCHDRKIYIGIVRLIRVNTNMTCRYRFKFSTKSTDQSVNKKKSNRTETTVTKGVRCPT